MRRSLFLLALAALLAPAAQAQGAFMPYLGYNFDEPTSPTVGVAVRFQPPMFPVAFQPGVEVTLDNGTNIQADLNAILPFNMPMSPISPWVGAGAAILIPDSDFEGSETSVAANLLAGAAFNAGFIKPFVQGRLTTDFDFAAFSAHLGAMLNF